MIPFDKRETETKVAFFAPFEISATLANEFLVDLANQFIFS